MILVIIYNNRKISIKKEKYNKAEKLMNDFKKFSYFLIF